jgi:protein gp37
VAENSKIEWTDHTFNPWIGCTKISLGCDGCYAEARMDKRLHRVRWGAGQPRQRTKTWGDPVRWNKQHEAFFAEHGRRQRVFCASLADVFDNEVDPAWRASLFALIAGTPNLDWLLLTKRIGNVAAMLEAPGMQKVFPANARIGATIVNQPEYDRDIGKLLRLDVPNFLSIEPMLGAIDLRLGGASMPDYSEHRPLPRSVEWVICGGESGPSARPMHPDWARSVRDQCAKAGVPFLFKQWGEWAEQDGDKPTRVFSMDTDVGETLASRCDGFISKAGEFVRDMDEATSDEPYRGMVRIGKKAAGRMLDGRTHDGFPEAA